MAAVNPIGSRANLRKEGGRKKEEGRKKKGRMDEEERKKEGEGERKKQ